MQKKESILEITKKPGKEKEEKNSNTKKDYKTKEIEQKNE